MINTYSLAKYVVVFDFPDNLPNEILRGQSLRIGGTESFLGNITFSRNSNLWSTDTDSTGSWVHNQNLDRHGTIDLNINQISDDVSRLIQICNIFESTSVLNGMTISLIPTGGESGTDTYATAIDCMPVKIPNQSFGSTASTQTWSFTAGRIDFTPRHN